MMAVKSKYITIKFGLHNNFSFRFFCDFKSREKEIILKMFSLAKHKKNHETVVVDTVCFQVQRIPNK